MCGMTITQTKDRSTSSRRRRSAAEWAEIVAAWKRSGLTAREYAQRHGLVAGTLLWWSSQGARRAAEPKGQHAPSPVTPAVAPSPAAKARGANTRASHPVTFLPVRVKDDSPASALSAPPPRLRLEVILSGGRRVRLRGKLTLSELSQVLTAIEGGFRC
jgi:transposase-like protein